MEIWQSIKDFFDPNLLTDWGMKIVFALLIFVVGFWLGKIFARLSERVVIRARDDQTLAHFLATVVSVIITVLALITALDQLGVPMTGLLAALGAAGLAIGLALKDSLSNFASGVILMIVRPFKAGDFVETASTNGVVERVGLFQTQLRSTSNQVILVPNTSVITANIVNYSERPTRRIDLTIGISYDDDIRQAREVIRKVIEADERLHREPAPIIWTYELNASSVDFAVKAWTNTDIYWDVRSDLVENIKYALDGAGITIPYPHHTVYHAAMNPQKG